MDLTKIINARTPYEAFGPSWRDLIKEAVIYTHPDKNPSPEARICFERVMEFKNQMSGLEFNDDTSKFKFDWEKTIIQTGPKSLIDASIYWYNEFKLIPELFRYIPEDMIRISETELKILLKRRSVPLNQCLPIELNHVKWILNRLFEFSALGLVKGQLIHAGLTLNSVMITPEDHGIQLISFYHSGKAGSKIRSIDASVFKANILPATVFSIKKFLSARTAI